MQKTSTLLLAFISISLLLLLTSCNSSDKLSLLLDTYVGYSKQTLIDQWGVPKSIEKDGRIQIYKYGREIYIPPSFSTSSYNTYGTQSGGEAFLNSFSNSLDNTSSRGGNYYCKISFFISDEIVKKTHWAYKGYTCKTYLKNKKFINKKYLLDLPSKSIETYGFSYEKTKGGLKITNIQKWSDAYGKLKKGDKITYINSKDLTSLPESFASDILANNNKIELKVKKSQETVTIIKKNVPVLETLSKSEKKYLGFY